MGECYIFGAGDHSGMRKRPGRGDIVIACDAGYLLCRAEGLKPDLTLGDFDSLKTPVEGENVVRVPVEKDDTDTMLALREGLARDCRVFHLYGCAGGERIDHTLANLQALAFADSHGARAYLYEKHFIFTCISDGSIEIEGDPGAIFSVFAVSGAAEHVTIEGGKYPLGDQTVTGDFPIGVSNHFSAPRARISVGCGRLLVCWQPRGDTKIE